MPGFGSDIMAMNLADKFSQGGGGGKFLTNFFGNKMVQQMLTSAGADILGRKGAEHTLANLNQNLASGNYANILKGILGGKLPENSKMSVDTKGVKLNIPNTPGVNVGPGATSSNITPGQLFGVGGGGGGSPNVPVAEGFESISAQGYPSPFASSQLDFSASDLAGIDPQLLTQALQLKLQGERAATERVGTEADIAYKRQLGAEAEARTKAIPGQTQSASMNAFANLYKAVKPEALDQAFPVKGADGSTMTVREWNALPQSEQEYAIYANDAKKNGDKVLSRREFQNLEPTERERFLREALKDPKLMGAAKELAQAGATRLTLSEKLEERSALDKLKGPEFFSSSDWAKSIDKISVYDDDVWDLSQKYQKEGLPLEQAKSKALRNSKILAIENKIAAGKGDVVDRIRKGNTVTWKVKWPDIKDSSGRVVKKMEPEDISYVVQ